MAVTDYSPSAGNNISVGGVLISEGWPPENANDAIRALMADIANGITNGDFTNVSGFQSEDATLTALAGLTVSDGGLIQATDADVFATLATTEYGRTLLALADSEALRTSIGGLTIESSLFGSPGFISINVQPGVTLTLQWGTGTIGGNSNGSISFATSFDNFGICVISGGSSDTGREGGVDTVGAAGVSSQAIVNNTQAALTYSYIAVGV